MKSFGENKSEIGSVYQSIPSQFNVKRHKYVIKGLKWEGYIVN